MILNLISVEIAIQHSNRPWKQSFVYEHHLGNMMVSVRNQSFWKLNKRMKKNFANCKYFLAKGNECKFKTYTQSDFALWYDYCSNLRHRKTLFNRNQNMISSTRFFVKHKFIYNIYWRMYNKYLLSFNFEQTFAFIWLTIVFLSGTFLAQKENFVVYHFFHVICVFRKK